MIVIFYSFLLFDFCFFFVVNGIEFVIFKWVVVFGIFVLCGGKMVIMVVLLNVVKNWEKLGKDDVYVC